MLSKGIELFLQFPNETKQRILHPGSVVRLVDEVVHGSFEESDLPVEPGLELMVYYERRRKFVKQPARVEAILTDAEIADAIESSESEESEDSDSSLSALTVALKVSGEPVSAESRQCYRVSTVIGDRTVVVGDEICKLLDVSATGYAVLSTAQRAPGEIVDAVVTVDDSQFAGKACVQSVKELATGQVRYGFYCADEQGVKGGLKDGIANLSMTVQREQLRRRAGAA